MSIMGYWNSLIKQSGFPWKEAEEPAWKPTIKPEYKDPTCPKCGLSLGDKMLYCCPHSHCPIGLN